MRLPRRWSRSWRAGAGVTAAAVTAVVWMGSPAGAVANGEDVPDGTYTFVADLEAHGISTIDGGTRESACSAALIAQQWIVSAGHCFHNGDPAGRKPTSGPVGPGQAIPYTVRALVGQATRSGSGGSWRTVVYALQVPVAGADLALARLNRPVTDVTPIRLASQPPVPGESVRLAGWGATTSPATVDQRPDRMQTGLFTIGQVTDTTLTVRGLSPLPTTSPCPYDSGAPYFRQARDGAIQLVGVEAGGPACPHNKYDSATRTDLSALRTWLRPALLHAMTASKKTG
jgi:hypothetical protein